MGGYRLRVVVGGLTSADRLLLFCPLASTFPRRVVSLHGIITSTEWRVPARRGLFPCPSLEKEHADLVLAGF